MMVSLGEIVAYGMSGVIAGLIIGLVVAYIAGKLIEARARQIYNINASKKGVAARQDAEQRMLEAIGLAMTRLKEQVPPGDIFKEVGAAYPDVIAKIAAQALKGKLPGGMNELFLERRDD